MPKQNTTVIVTILAGDSVSSAADLSTGAVSMIYVPQDWTAANIGFLVSYDNADFRNLVDQHGVEILKPTVAGAAVLVDPSQTAAALWLKIRSGPSADPVIQETDSVFRLVVTA